ncbi:serine hydrolase domain-containing protein [Streptomyces sp. Da 82-17]|uniref:serine hydrolase domain-containing protein n=1 Tax=Streptomyces sp. Da 82-17 TaxID=3377116 RepID=UPI0038D4AF92
MTHRPTPTPGSRTARSRAALAAALVLAFAAGPLSAPAHADARPAAHAASREAEARGGQAEADGPDVAALERALRGLPDAAATSAEIRVGGRGSWYGIAGVHDVETGRKALRNARFRAGSTTKVVTAAVVLQLVAEGRLDLDGTVQEYLPGLLGDDFGPVTVRQLLNFTSGLQGGRTFGDTVDEEFPHRFETLPPEEVVATGVAKGPRHAPGAEQHYGNIHYLVLAMLIEKVTGDTYEHQAETRVFKPVGMRHTSFPVDPDPTVHGPHNRGYEDMDGRLVDVTEWNMADRKAAGDMISTTADLERLLFAVFRGELVPEPQLREMFTVPDVPGATRSASLERFVVDGRVVWGKTGARPGYHTVVAATRDLSRTVVYAVTATDAKGDGLRLAQRFAFPAFNR